MGILSPRHLSLVTELPFFGKVAFNIRSVAIFTAEKHRKPLWVYRKKGCRATHANRLNAALIAFDDYTAKVWGFG